MKYFTILVALILFVGMQSCIKKNKNADELMIISGTVLLKDMYCGGAAPSQEVLDYYKEENPIKGYKLYLKKGHVNNVDQPIIAETSTDEFGKFSFSLPKGKYILLSEYQINKDILTSGKDIKVMNLPALEKWWLEGLGQFDMDKSIELRYKKRCYLPVGVPFLHYGGPVAP